MIPGYGSSRLREETVASAASIIVKGDFIRLTGATAIDNISSPLMMGRDALLIYVMPTDGALIISAAGNVSVANNMVLNRVYTYIFSATDGKWHPQL